MTEEFSNYDIESFHTFVQYLIARGPEAAAGGHFGVRVRHWTRFYDICHFCAIDWDFIGKVESIYVGKDWINRMTHTKNCFRCNLVIEWSWSRIFSFLPIFQEGNSDRSHQKILFRLIKGNTYEGPARRPQSHLLIGRYSPRISISLSFPLL